MHWASCGEVSLILSQHVCCSYGSVPAVSIDNPSAHDPLRLTQVWNVFFAIALLHLPKLSMATFFVRAVEIGSELVVGLRRIGAFLDMQEPSAVARMDDDTSMQV